MTGGFTNEELGDRSSEIGNYGREEAQKDAKRESMEIGAWSGEQQALDSGHSTLVSFCESFINSERVLRNRAKLNCTV
jgi:hypothetical protein